MQSEILIGGKISEIMKLPIRPHSAGWIIQWINLLRSASTHEPRTIRWRRPGSSFCIQLGDRPPSRVDTVPVSNSTAIAWSYYGCYNCNVNHNVHVQPSKLSSKKITLGPVAAKGAAYGNVVLSPDGRD